MNQYVGKTLQNEGTGFVEGTRVNRPAPLKHCLLMAVLGALLLLPENAQQERQALLPLKKQVTQPSWVLSAGFKEEMSPNIQDQKP